MVKYNSQALSPIAFYGIGLAPIVLLCISALEALKFGAVLIVAMVLCNLLYFAFKPIVVDSVRIPCYVLLIIGVEYLIDSILSEFVPNNTAIVTNMVSYLFSATVIIYMFETSSKVKDARHSMLDCVIMGGEYALCMFVVGLVREILGFGRLFGANLFGGGIGFFASSAGAVMLVLIYAYVYNIIFANINKKRVAYSGLVDRYELFLEDKFMELTPMKTADEITGSENLESTEEKPEESNTNAEGDK